MNHANLTARYRPQQFAELAGQETIRAILSRAAAEDKVAPAYLFSGTRGVGKTTVARIFAKALNCTHAPAPEPCNECERCRQITLGTAVDVVEIDGASNRGIDDVRKLKEVVGYAPMEGRYRVFIIDEAHMLSRDAFNALLKTLEEPPSNVTFILATTEPHKFPATIISRCQHYVFKRLPESGLEAHLSSVLTREGVGFDESAIRLIARRAAGSVRDAMSLLGQVLALGGDSLTEEDARNVLGLAGQELFFTLFATLRQADSVAVTRLVGSMLDSGLDLGFFLREMALCWRNMFILRQSGDAALHVLDIPAKEAERWKQEAAAFDLAHIHAAWQMTIDGQRRVLTSLEPALALELLLLNIAMLPKLLPLEDLSRAARAGGPGPSGSSGLPGAPAPGSESGPATGHSPGSPPGQASSSPTESMAESMAGAPAGQAGETVSDQAQGPDPASGPGAVFAADTPNPQPPFDAAPTVVVAKASVSKPSVTVTPVVARVAAKPAPKPASGPKLHAEAPQPVQVTVEVRTVADPAPRTLPDDCSWSAFLRFCKQQQLSAAFTGMLRTLEGAWKNNGLELTPASEFGAERLASPETKTLFEALVREYYGEGVAIRVLPPPRMKTATEVREELRNNPSVKLLEKEMGARLIDYGVTRMPAKEENDAPGDSSGNAARNGNDAEPIQ